jgi:uncharacterized membrane protein YfhO
VEGLVNAGVKPLRVGGNVQKSLIEHSLDHKLESHPLHPTLLRAVTDEEKLSRSIHDLGTMLKEQKKKIYERVKPDKSMLEKEDNMRNGLISKQNQSKNLQMKIYAIRQQMLRETVQAADVVSAQI